MKPIHVHIFGASGSGTTALARDLSAKLNLQHFDTDNYFWLPTDPPFQTRRPVSARIELLKHDLLIHKSWVLSGCISKWGGSLIPLFSHAIYILTPVEERLKRIKNREVKKHGHRIEVGGDMHSTHLEFLEWAALYDENIDGVRSKALHESFINQMPCPVLHLDGRIPIENMVHQTAEFLSQRS